MSDPMQPNVAVIALAICAVAVLSAPLSAQQNKPAEEPPADMLKQVRELEEQAKKMGTWDRESLIIQEAHANVFARLNWNSEADRFALDLVNRVSTIPPWEPKRREQIFLDGVQSRFGLNADQLNLVNSEMRRESIAIAMKHFRTLAPIVMDVARTRAEGKPFTPEQVAKWSANLDPIMADALEAVQRVSTRLESTMTEEQKRLLQADMDAVLNRHKDVVNMVQEWKAGNWSPVDWGLDRDPVHAAAMAEFREQEARRNALVVEKLTDTRPSVDPANEHEWDLYVRWFCKHYECDEKQVLAAQAILKDCKQQAANYLSRRQSDIDRALRNAEAAQTDKRREFYQNEAAKLRKPIANIFKDLCTRLERKVLTGEQLKKKPKDPPASAAAAAAAAPAKRAD